MDYYYHLKDIASTGWFRLLCETELGCLTLLYFTFIGVIVSGSLRSIMERAVNYTYTAKLLLEKC